MKKLMIGSLAFSTMMSVFAAAEETIAPAANAEASVAAANADAELAAEDSDAKLEKAFADFLKKKDGFSAYGKAHSTSGIIYYSASSFVNGNAGNKDTEFLQKRQTAFLRAFSEIREGLAKYSLNSALSSEIDNHFLKDKTAEEQQSIPSVNQVERLAQKTMALEEAELDRKLADQGVDPTGFTTVADKRKALCQKIVAKASARALASVAGLSVVKTMEASGADGYSIGIIAKFDPQYVYYADCMAKKKRPNPGKRGIDIGTMLKGKLVENFGTRFFYDEKGMPALISFGQWAAPEVQDRTERKLQEKAALIQAESLANIEMNNFIKGAMTYEEATLAGEEYAKTKQYDERGLPIASTYDDTLNDYVNRTSAVKAVLNLGGRDVVFKKMLVHPDTKQRLAVAAVVFSYDKLAQQQRVEEIRLNAQKDPTPEVQTPAAPAATGVLREGDTYDF